MPIERPFRSTIFSVRARVSTVLWTLCFRDCNFPSMGILMVSAVILCCTRGLGWYSDFCILVVVKKIFRAFNVQESFVV